MNFFTFVKNNISRLSMIVNRTLIVSLVLADQFSEQTFSRDV